MFYMQNNQLMTTKPVKLINNIIVINYKGYFTHVTKGHKK